VAVRDELPRLGARRGEAEPVEDVVEPRLQEREQVLAHGALAAPRRGVDVAAELPLAHAGVALGALLLAQLAAVDRLAPAPPRPVLARGSRPAALDRGLAVQRALALQEELDSLAP
jgi:hypothetical protein